MDKLKSILLVDDDEIANHLHKLLIECMDICDEVLVAEDGEEALGIIGERLSEDTKSQEILILMDINMPGMDAFDFLEKFEEVYNEIVPNLHVALLSSSVNSKDLKKATKYRIEDYLDKPLTEGKLTNLIYKIRSDKENKGIGYRV